VRTQDIKDVILVGGMTRMPAVAESVKKFFGRDPCRGVHPEEVVALGAAIQANALVVSSTSVVLLDVTPHSLGVAIAGGYASTIIPKNSTVPTSATEMYATSKDYQTTVKIMVLQGESEIASQNELLGEFVLSGLRASLRGEVEIAVTFDISADGIVSVSAKDTATGKRQSITVTASGGLTQEELARIMEEQRDYLLEAQSDEEVRRRRTELSSLVADVEEVMPRLREHALRGALGREVLSRAEQQLERARQAAQGKALPPLVASCDEMAKAAAALKAVVQRLDRGG
jgi:molecular chaperone DnaK